MNKNYKQCSFKLTLPTLSETKEDYLISFHLMTEEVKSGRFVLKSVEMKDQLGHILEEDPSGNNYEIIPPKMRETLAVKIEKKGINCLLAGSRLRLDLLDEEAKEHVSVEFLMDKYRKYRVDAVEVKSWEEGDQKYFKKRVTSTSNQSQEYNNMQIRDRVQKSLVKETSVSKAYEHEFVHKYKQALMKEINFLKSSGGRKYKITNGRLISQKEDEYAYVFELESELYLPDASPIRLRCQLGESGGEVLSCEDFSLVILLKDHLGPQISVAYVTVEPWKLLKALCDKLDKFGDGEDFPIAKQLIEEGPLLAEKRPIQDLRKGQMEAFLSAQKNPITIVWGPPGTGKTYTMSRLALKFAREKKRVIIVSHSNVSVDGVIKKIIERLEEKGEENKLAEGFALRYGYVRDEVLSRHDYGSTFNYCIQRFPELVRQKTALEEEKKELKAKGLMQSAQGVDTEKRLQHLRIQIKEHEKSAIKRAQIVATTISKVTIDTLFEDMQYDVVMFDEASMAYVSQVFAAACLARKHFICVGDFQQLSPIAQSKNKQELEEDIFSYLNIVNGFGKIHYHPWLVMLDIQRRMHPLIARYVSRVIYSGLLKSERTFAERIQAITDLAPFEGKPLIQIDLSGTYCAAGKNNDHSRFNVLSACIAFKTALDCEGRGGHQVGIITPYAAQTRLIRAMILDYKKDKKTQIICSTVHQFQGSESEVIIFDAIESYPLLGPGWLLSKNENNHVTRLINVAVTRAKGKLITISHNRFWENTAKSPSHALLKLIDYQKSESKQIQKEVLKDYLISHRQPKIRFFREEKYIELFLTDIQKAKQRIQISLPSGRLGKEEKIILKTLKEATRKGVQVGIKCGGYKELPSEWKSLSVGADNAAFPLVVIDERVVWYGAPLSETHFVEGKEKYYTTTHIIARFKGKHTVEMIQSLTELGEVIVGKQRRPLIGEYKNQGIYGLQGVNLNHFIQERYRCPVCKKPIRLKKGKSGKSYLGCTQCDHMAYLTTELVNHYMDIKNIVCPVHKVPLEAKVGQYGVYLQCGEGDERHYLKPDEI